MEPLERARIAVGIEHQFTEAMRSSITFYAHDPDEQIEIAAGVIALMLRKMYLVRGPLWLEAVLTQVLQPRPEP